MAGSVAALANYRRRKHHRKYRRNPPNLGGIARGTLGLPPMMPVVYGAAGFMGTAAIQGVIDGFMPASMKASTGLLAKYGEILASIVIVSYVAKTALGRGAAAFAAVGGGIFLIQQAAHDLVPGVIPGMNSYTPLRAYTPVRRGSLNGPSAGGEWPSLAGMRAPDHGAQNNANFAADGGRNLVAERFRRFA